MNLIKQKMLTLALSTCLTAGVFMPAQAATPTELILLGTKGGPSLLQHERLPQSTALAINDKVWLFDAGYGASLRLLQANLALKNLQALFITHLHSDHIADYPALLSNAWSSGLNHQLPVYGPIGTEAMTQGVWQTFARDIALRIVDEGKPDLRNLVSVTDIQEGIVYQQDGLTVSALFVPHPPFNNDEALAYKINVNGKVIVITGDMIDNKPIIEFAKNADYLISEVVLVEGVEKLARRIGNGATLAKAIISHHTTAEEVGKIAAQAKVKHLVLTHLVPSDDPNIIDADWLNEVNKHYRGPVTVGKDLMRFKLN